MARSFTLDMIDDQRPSVYIGRRPVLTAMIDTGALFPVWVDEESVLSRLGGTLIKEGLSFSGFGGKTVGNVYRLTEFVFGELVYPDFPIVACRTSLACHMILPATMFQNLIYTIDNRTHRLTITIPDDESLNRRLQIRDSDGNTRVLCTSME